MLLNAIDSVFYWPEGLHCIGSPGKKFTDLLGFSNVTLALVVGLSLLKCSSIVILMNIETSFVGIDAVRGKMITLKAQITSNPKPELLCFGINNSSLIKFEEYSVKLCCVY